MISHIGYRIIEDVFSNQKYLTLQFLTEARYKMVYSLKNSNVQGCNTILVHSSTKQCQKHGHNHEFRVLDTY